jgi:hypothetical protein
MRDIYKSKPGIGSATSLLKRGAYLHLAICWRTLMGFTRREWQERLIV